LIGNSPTYKAKIEEKLSGFELDLSILNNLSDVQRYDLIQSIHFIANAYMFGEGDDKNHYSLPENLQKPLLYLIETLNTPRTILVDYASVVILNLNGTETSFDNTQDEPRKILTFNNYKPRYTFTDYAGESFFYYAHTLIEMIGFGIAYPIQNIIKSTEERSLTEEELVDNLKLLSNSMEKINDLMILFCPHGPKGHLALGVNFWKDFKEFRGFFSGVDNNKPLIVQERNLGLIRGASAAQSPTIASISQALNILPTDEIAITEQSDFYNMMLPNHKDIISKEFIKFWNSFKQAIALYEGNTKSELINQLIESVDSLIQFRGAHDKLPTKAGLTQGTGMTVVEQFLASLKQATVNKRAELGSLR
jgi:hypothetical protein